MDIFEKFLSVWVLICMGVGVLIGHFVPAIPDALATATVANVSIPLSILLWAMITPMMLQIEWSSLRRVFSYWHGVAITSTINYAIQPFAMYALALLFFKVIFASVLSDEIAKQYIAGAVILGGSPCTAMVFVWSTLVNGCPTYTLAQVAVNDILILILYSPTVKLLLSVSDVRMAWSTLLLSIVVFVAIPLTLGVCVRWLIIRFKSKEFLEQRVLKIMHSVTIVALLLTLVLIFISQAANIVARPVHILIIGAPLILMSYGIWALAISVCYAFRLPYDIAAPASMIASSNFFELAVAVCVAMYGSEDGSTLVTTVGVLVEVPVMLSLVFVCNKWCQAPIVKRALGAAGGVQPVDAAVEDKKTAQPVDGGESNGVSDMQMEHVGADVATPK